MSISSKNNLLKSPCYVCYEEIDYDTFECGHIKSLFYGGKTCLNNLVAICRCCNNDMGIKNLELYKKELKLLVNN